MQLAPLIWKDFDQFKDWTLVYFEREKKSALEKAFNKAFPNTKRFFFLDMCLIGSPGSACFGVGQQRQGQCARKELLT